jgi:hypothetical protein
LQKLNLDIQLLKNSTTKLLMANSRVQQESKMQEQHYGVNTRPVMTTIEQFRYHLQSQVTLSEGKENHQKQNTNTERDRHLHQTALMKRATKL